MVEDCTVQSTGNDGLIADVVNHSSAYLSGYEGIAAYVATDCTGSSTYPYGSAIFATVANNCYGTSPNGTGVYSSHVANCCTGQSTTGIAIWCKIAIGCSVMGGTTNITYKYNMP